MATELKDGEWLKDVDFARTVENTLMGIILFIGRYFKTFVLVMFRPKRLESDLVFNDSYKTFLRIDYTRPLSFLVVSGFVYLGFTLSTEGSLIPIERVITSLHSVVERLPHKIEDLTLTKISAFMVPFVLFVAFYALILSLLSVQFGSALPFKVSLNISAYISGCYAVLTNLLAAVEGPLWDVALGNKREALAIPLVATVTLYLALMTWCTYRYLDFLRRATKLSFPKTVALALVSFVAFWLSMVGGLYPLGPFLTAL